MKVGLYFSFTQFSFNALNNKKIRFYLGRLDWWKDHFKNRLVCLENLSNFFYTKWNLSQRLSFVSCWSIFVTCVNNCHKSLLTALCVKMCGELVCGKSGHFVITIFLSQSQQQHSTSQIQHCFRCTKGVLQGFQWNQKFCYGTLPHERAAQAWLLEVFITQRDGGDGRFISFLDKWLQHRHVHCC